MKTLILWILVLTIAYVSNAQNVDIPDTAFLYALIDEGVDTNGDSLISYEEAEAVTSLDVSHESICDEDSCWFVRQIAILKGIEAFINLDTLNCSWNKLTSLDVSNNTALTDLSCHHNQLTSLDVSGCTALTSLSCGCGYWGCGGNQLTNLDVSNNSALKLLDCSSTQLTSLDVSNNTALEWLYCSHNQLTRLDVSNNTTLTELSCSSNRLTYLDVSNNTSLTSLSCSHNQLNNLAVSNTPLIYLACHNNQLTSLDVSGCTALEMFYCDDNQLTSLDVSKNIALKSLRCGPNQLTCLDVSSCTALKELWIYHMPTLYELCVWVIPFPPADVYFNKKFSPNVYFTLNCSDKLPTVYDTIFYIDENSPKSAIVGYVQATGPYYNLLEFAIIDGNINETFSITNSGLVRVANVDSLDYESIPQFILTVVVTERVNSISDTAFVTINLIDVVDIRAHESTNKLTIHPNPSDDIINIEIENPINTTIEIYNVGGRLIFSKAIDSKVEKFDISDFPKGIYLLKVRQADAVYIGKVVVR